MFGYIDINRETLDKGKQGFWQSFMCGLCFSTKKMFGNISRMAITNDVNFFNVLFHSVLDSEVKLEEKKCFSHPLKKQAMLEVSPLTDKIAIAHVILVYYNLLDDVLDGSKKKKIALNTIKKDYEKAKGLWGEFDEVLNDDYQELRKLEKTAGNKSLDLISHPFAELSRSFAKLVLEDKYNDTVGDLCYNVGKWVYLIDALDDVKEDLKHKQFNAFTNSYGADSLDFVAENKEEITFVMYAVLNRIAQCYNDLNKTMYSCLLENIIFESMRNKTKQILNKKLK